jgi:hypothetical protein
LDPEWGAEQHEQGISPADIVQKTGHTQNAVDRYIKTYDQVLQLAKKKHDAISICQITGRSMSTIRQYFRLVKDFHPTLSVGVPDRSTSLHQKLSTKNGKESETGQMS